MRKEFTEMEVKFISEHYKDMTYQQIAVILGRDRTSICNFISYRKMKKNHMMTCQMAQFIIANFDDMTIKDLAKEVGLESTWLSQWCRSIGLKKYKTRRDCAKRVSHKDALRIKKETRLNHAKLQYHGTHGYQHYTGEEIGILTSKKYSDEEAAILLDRTTSAVKQMRWKLKNSTCW